LNSAPNAMAINTPAIVGRVKPTSRQGVRESQTQRKIATAANGGPARLAARMTRMARIPIEPKPRSRSRVTRWRTPRQ